MVEEFFTDKMFNCLGIYDSQNFYNVLYEDYSDYNNRDSFSYIKNSVFYDFFYESRVDVPRVFKKTKSVRRPQNELFLLKLNNYIMRDGDRYKSYKLLNYAINKIYSSNKDSKNIFNVLIYE